MDIPGNNRTRLSWKQHLRWMCGLIGLMGLMAFGAGLSRTKSATENNSEIVSQSFSAQSTTDWPNLFGPTHRGLSAELGLNLDWPAEGPPQKWSQSIGYGYSSPVVLGEHLMLFHRIGDEEIVETLDPETGASRWRHAYPTAFQCKYEYSNGPYATPVIDDDSVYTWGAEGLFHALDLNTGSVIWKRQLSEEFAVPEKLFAVGSSPLLEADRLILNVGGKKPNSGIVALDKTTGKTLWSATDDGAGYATPIAATIHGRRYVFVFTELGLVSLDPRDGRVWWSVPFRSKTVDSVNATSPVVWNDLILVTIGPGPGCLCLRILPEGSYEEVWRDRRAIDSTFNNLICRDGYVYGFSSMRNRGASFRCVDMQTGKLMWEWSSDLCRGASLWVENRCIVLGEYGYLGMVDDNPRELQVRYLSPQPMFKRPCYSAPALSNGLLFIRNELELACYDLRKK